MVHPLFDLEYLIILPVQVYLSVAKESSMLTMRDSSKLGFSALVIHDLGPSCELSRDSLD